MRFTHCPACGGPVNEGSHWDCVFELLEERREWRKAEKRSIDVPVPGALADKPGAVAPGGDVATEGVPERKDG